MCAFIENLKNSESIIANLRDSLDEIEFKELRSQLEEIVCFSDDKKEQIYLLGHYFKDKYNLFDLPENCRRKLLRDIKSAGLEEYFTLKRMPKNSGKDKLTIIILLSGIIIFAAGILQMWSGNFWVGIGTKFNTFIVREGGYKVIFGGLLIVGSFFRHHFIRKKLKILKPEIQKN